MNTDINEIELPVGENASMIRHIVGRLHVSTPTSEVVAYVKSKIKSWDKLPLKLRIGIVKFATDVHVENMRIYLHVMGGHKSG